MRRIVIGMLGGLVLLAAGCSNPYLANYQGQKFPRTTSVVVVTTTPASEQAHLIGVSTFAATNDPGRDAAVAAAEDIGANMVQWDRSYQGTSTQLELQPIFGPYTSGAAWAEGGSMVDVEQPVREKWYRYHARFYRNADGS